MQNVKPIPTVNRTLIFLWVVAGLIAISWGLARWQSLPLSPTLIEHYFSGVTNRTGASTDRLIQSLQARLETNGNDWQAYSQLGLAYLQKARETGDPTIYQKVEESFQKSLALEPQEYTALSGMGALALARHQFSQALEWGQQAQQLNPYRSYAYGVIADAQIELGRYEEATQTLQTMVDLRPDLSVYTRISYIRELHGDMEGALAMMQQAVDSSSASPENAAWTRTQLANLYFETGELEKAGIEYERTLAYYPGYIYALAGLGRVRAAQGQTEEAISLLTQATEVTPLPEFAMTLGDIYQAAGQPEAAQKQYALVQTIQKLYQANGVEIDLELALFNADQGDNPTEAVRQAQAAMARQPNIHAADVLAWALYQAGDYQAAQTFAEQALRLGTQDAHMLYHAGMIAYRLGDEQQARTYLEEALALNPHFSILQADEARHTLEVLAE